MNRPTKQDCLRHYARYDEPTYFVQLDGFDQGDDVMGMDAEGQAVMGRETYGSRAACMPCACSCGLDIRSIAWSCSSIKSVH